MLASIIKYSKDLPDEDISIFLNEEEIKELRNTPLSGKIFESRDIRKIYSLEMKVDERHYGPVKVEREPNMYIVLICEDDYLKLEEKGWVGGRPDTFSKIDIMSEYAANQDEESRNLLRNINFLWKNRDRIIEKMKKEGL